MHIFLSKYEILKDNFALSMGNLTGAVLSFDHTFKVSKHVEILRNDKSFVKHFDNCFFGMNEYGGILTWQLTKSTNFSEIKDLLVDLN